MEREGGDVAVETADGTMPEFFRVESGLEQLCSWHCELGNLWCLLEYWLMAQNTPGERSITFDYFLSADICSGNSHSTYFS